jgi:hypothetical protein
VVGGFENVTLIVMIWWRCILYLMRWCAEGLCGGGVSVIGVSPLLWADIDEVMGSSGGSGDRYMQV